MVADRIGAGRVLLAGVLLVALGTALIPFMHGTAGLVLAIGVLSAGGAGMAGPAVLMSATTGWCRPNGAAWPPASSTPAARSGSSCSRPSHKASPRPRAGWWRCRAWPPSRCWRCLRPGCCAATPRRWRRPSPAAPKPPSRP
jgi:hypothetical protein